MLKMLSDKEILDEMKKGNVIIEPFDERQLNSNSYDVRLGEYIAIGYAPQRIIDIYNEEDVKNYWKIKKANDIITLFPGETILSHTKEVIGGEKNIATKMNARSSLGRCGISVCKCAGFGDVGYVNKWTMEITNHLEVAVALKVGMRVAQISFFRVGEVLNQYSGKYLRRHVNWKPEDMIPRLWEDWELKENEL